MSKQDDEQEDIIGRSWDLVQEALRRGTITLEGSDPAKPNQRVLETKDLVDLAKFFVQLKVKKPQVITPPEDYNLKPTTGDADED